VVGGALQFGLGQTSFEIPHDRNANKGTPPVEESVRRRSGPTTAAVPMRRGIAPQQRENRKLWPATDSNGR
jgi:hypothetical protein